jgi:hypothetical protein
MPPISSVDEWDNEHPMSRAEQEALDEAEYIRAMERAQYEAYCDDMRQRQAADEAYAEEAARARAEAEAAQWAASGGAE